MKLWRFNKITGMWNYVRSLTDETKNEWLLTFQKYEPNETFIVSKNKPSKLIKRSC